MRITNLMTQNNMLGYINGSRERIADLQERIASGSKVMKPSDNPGDAVSILNLDRKISRAETYQGNIDNALPFMKETTSAMEMIYDEMEQIVVELANLKNSAASGSEEIIAEKIRSKLDFIVETANAEYDGKYLFGGTDVSGKPFEIDPDYGVDPLVLNKYAIAGDNTGEQKLKLSENESLKVNMTGHEVFGDLDGTDIFNRLDRVVEQLAGGNLPSDAEIDGIKDFNKNLLSKLSEAGNAIDRIVDKSELLENQKNIYKDLLSKDKDVDVAEAIMNLQNEDYVLQLAYKVSSSVMPKSLMDYL